MMKRMRATGACWITMAKTKFLKWLTVFSQCLISITTTKSTLMNSDIYKKETFPSTTHSQILQNLLPSLIKTMMALSTAKSFSLYSAKLPMAIASFKEMTLMRKTAKPVGRKEMETKSVVTLTKFGSTMAILVAADDYDQPQIVTRLNLHLRSS